MSSDEEALAVGRIVAEHREIKNRYTALRSVGDRLGSEIASIGALLRYGHPLGDHDLSVLNADKLRSHTAEITSTWARLQELEKQLAELGLAPKPPER